MKTLNVEIDKSQYKKKNCLTCRHSDTNNNGISCKESYPLRWETCNQHYSLYKPIKPILHLVLKHKWYEKIKSGEKRTEYRAYSTYWNKRFKLDDLLESVNYGNWEQHNSPVPKGHKVIFLDGNKENIVIENLMLASQAELCEFNCRLKISNKNSEITKSGIALAKLKCAVNKKKKETK